MEKQTDTTCVISQETAGIQLCEESLRKGQFTRSKFEETWSRGTLCARIHKHGGGLLIQVWDTKHPSRKFAAFPLHRALQNLLAAKHSQHHYECDEIMRCINSCLVAADEGADIDMGYK